MRNNLSMILIPVLLLFASSSLMSAQNNAEWGLASYYSDDFQGKTTAYGVAYNKNELTAAHKLHPFGTMLKVTRLDNNKSVTVKVIDKGPYIKGRVVDISRAAAEKIGLVTVGVAEVKVEVVGRSKAKPATVNTGQPERTDIPTSFENTAPRKKEVASTESRSQADTNPKPKASSSSQKAATTKSSSKKASSSKKVTTKAKGTAKAQFVGKEFEKYGLYKVSIQKPEPGDWGVQIVSLTNYENVFTEVANLQERGFRDILISIEEGGLSPMYKVILGPFETEASAENYRKNLLKRYKIKGFVKELNKTE
jgi:rare lipoprotein A